MARKRLDRGIAMGSCEQCGLAGPLKVYDSYERTRRLGIVPVRTHWYRTWVCPACRYALRRPLLSPEQCSSTA